jgi:hypothetical protein
VKLQLLVEVGCKHVELHRRERAVRAEYIVRSYERRAKKDRTCRLASDRYINSWGVSSTNERPTLNEDGDGGARPSKIKIRTLNIVSGTTVPGEVHVQLKLVDLVLGEEQRS